jgi:hypothetical protein
MIMTRNGIVIRNVLFTTAVFATACIGNKNRYAGEPYSDSNRSGAQEIPGRLQCEFFDTGGEGVAFHDSDTTNSGSGALNPADGTYLNEFRINEPVDISYTKFREPLIDNSPFNLVNPEPDQLYVGWTAPGEWTKYTVDVKQSGKYSVGLMYTANQNGKISIAVNDVDASGPLDIPATYVAADTIPWRQWHHWNYLDKLAIIDLHEGKQTLTLHTVAVGQMNYEHVDFKLIE